MNDKLPWEMRTGAPRVAPRLAANLTQVTDRELLAELSRRGVVNFRMNQVPDSDLWREVGRRRQAKRKVRRGGRPRKRPARS
jgi:hypothetical protein